MNRLLLNRSTKENHIPNFVSILIFSFFTICIAFGFSGSGETSKADSCKQQICLKHPNGTPAGGYYAEVKNSSGNVVAQWTSDPDGCIPHPDGGNFNSGELHTIHVVTDDCYTAPMEFTPCTSKPVIFYICE